MELCVVPVPEHYVPAYAHPVCCLYTLTRVPASPARTGKQKLRVTVLSKNSPVCDTKLLHPERQNHERGHGAGRMEKIPAEYTAPDKMGLLYLDFLCFFLVVCAIWKNGRRKEGRKWKTHIHKLHNRLIIDPVCRRQGCLYLSRQLLLLPAVRDAHAAQMWR